MSKLKQALPFLTILILSTGCLKKVTVENFDQDTWASDPKGCQSKRIELIPQINENKKKLLGLYQKDILKILGQPEEQELYKRSQTYYIYYLDAAQSCDQPVENPRKLFIRFTSLGIANELTIR